MTIRRWTCAWAGLSATSLLLGAFACGHRHPVSTAQVVQYYLVSIDGQPLPHQVDQSPDGSVTTAVTDMVLSVVEDGTWHSTGHETVTTNGVASVQLLRSGGMYVAAGSNFTFRDASGTVVWQGTFSFPPPIYTLTNAQSHEYVFCRSDFGAAQCGLQAAPVAQR